MIDSYSRCKYLTSLIKEENVFSVLTNMSTLAIFISSIYLITQELFNYTRVVDILCSSLVVSISSICLITQEQLNEKVIIYQMKDHRMKKIYNLLGMKKFRFYFSKTFSDARSTKYQLVRKFKKIFLLTSFSFIFLSGYWIS